MKFEWDDAKNQSNVRKHGISFESAIRIFDGFTFTSVDDLDDYGEVRECTIGAIGSLAVVVVVHTDRSGVVRIISARRAHKRERRFYEQEIRKSLD